MFSLDMKKIGVLALFSPFCAVAQTDLISNPAISVVLDGYYQTKDKSLSERSRGFGLGETELSLSGSIDDVFYGKFTTVLEANEDNTEVELEEAFVQTLFLPAGFTMRGGRFLSDIGYLNNIHLHSDSFVERPLVYRAFLGNHYFDDGFRISYVFPTPIYWQVGLEALKGNKLRAEDEHGERVFKNVGVYTFHSKWGGDIGVNNSWQFGLSYLRNENGRLTPHDENEQQNEEENADEHSHDAAFNGENTYIADMVYKWAPDGNYKYQHLMLSAEYFRVTDVLPQNESSNNNDYYGWYLSGVYQLSPKWSTGIRYGTLSTLSEENEVFIKQKSTEVDAMVAWHHSHFSTLRFQYSNQSLPEPINGASDHVFTLQYIMTLGAHNAHQF